MTAQKLALALVCVCTCCGCVSYRDYHDQMQLRDSLNIPRESYRNWRLFRNQSPLHDLYLELLKIDKAKALAELGAAQAECDQQYKIACMTRGATNDMVALNVSREEEILAFDFLMTHTASALLVVWESWGGFVYAEEYFRSRMTAAEAPPRAAYRAFALSDKHRRAIGQMEAALSDRLGGGQSDITEERDKANRLLTSLQSDPTLTPFAKRLCGLSREELRLSDAAVADQRASSAAQWVRDAWVTAQSAQALSELERRRNEVSMPGK